MESIAGGIAIGSLSAVFLGEALTPPDPIGAGRTQAILLPFGIAGGLLWMYYVSPEISNRFQ